MSHAIIYYGGDPFLSVARGLVLIERQSDDDDLIKKEGERDDDDDENRDDEDAFGGVGKKNDSCGRRWHLEISIDREAIWIQDDVIQAILLISIIRYYRASPDDTKFAELVQKQS